MNNKLKRLANYFSLLMVVVFATNLQAQIYAPDGLRMPGEWNGWDNEQGMGGDFDLQRITSGTLRWQTTFQYTGNTGPQMFKFVSTSYGNVWGNQWADNQNVSINSIENFTFSGEHIDDNMVVVTQNNWYTVVFEDNGYENSRAVFMETISQPVDITSVIQNPPIVEEEDEVLITANLSASPSPEEVFYLRYTSDNWDNSTILTMSIETNAASATIPQYESGITIEYYIFSSVISDLSDDFDLFTLRFNNNNDNNFSYTVGQPISCGEENSLITTNPTFPLEDVPVTIFFNAEFGNGGLINYAGDVYAHTGVITSESESTSDWRYVKTDWGENTPETKLERLGANLYSLEIDNIRDYYEVPADEDILYMAFVFRSDEETEDGYYLEHKTSEHGDIFIEVYELELNVKILSPSKREPLVSPNEVIAVCVEALENEELSLYLNDDLLLSETGTSLMYPLVTQELEPGTHWLIAKASSGADIVYDSTAIYLRGPVVEESLPEGVKNGINYIDDNTVTLVLHDPPALKQFAFAIGDYSNWLPNDDNYMKWDPETNRFWVTITGLEPQTEYAFQYYIDSELRLACPYTEKVLDPWNDRWIPDITYPDLKPYPFDLTTGIVSVLQTARQPYQWEVDDFEPVAVHETQPNLIIYELLLRDFTEVEGTTYNHIGDINHALEKLDYLEALGVNAIQLMPFNEFEGNDSWGYNPSFFFATDKAYGTREDYKRFIDECHKRGIAVIMDIVLNHAFSQNTLVQMYFDPEAGEWGQPSAENPWFNQVAPNPVWNWGSDFNHESPYTRQFAKDVFEYWLTEFNIDGFRLDFTKGFTNTPGDGWAYDQSRIDILKDYYDHIKSVNQNAYVILEHFTDNSEEVELANYGMLLWGNLTHQYGQNVMGWEDNHDFSWAYYPNRGFDYPNLLTYLESHDEERIIYNAVNFGATGANTLSEALRRKAAIAAMYMAIPGPKMIWQFGELGYDYSINHCPDGTISSDCRTARKPVRWDYLDDPERYELFLTYAALNKLKTENEAFRLGDFSQDLSGMGKRMWISHSSMNVAISANFSTNGFNMQPGFQNTGTWYNYFTGESFEVTDVGGHTIYYEPGDFYVFVNQDLGKPFYDVNITVIDDENEQPIENAIINLGTAGQRTSDINGEAAFTALTGEYELVVTKYGWITYTEEITVDQELNIIIRLIEDDLPELYSVTFNVDMTPAIEDESFNPEEDFVDLAGDFLDWGSSGEMEYVSDNIYTYTTDEIFEAGTLLKFKFRINGDWDTSEFPDGGADREYIVVEGENIYNAVYNDYPDDNGNIVAYTGQNNVTVYPNPTRGIININTLTGSKVFLYDINGNKLNRKKCAADNCVIDMGAYNSGVYFLKIVFENEVVIRKIIKW